MVISGKFEPPAMAYRHQSYPAIGRGSIEVTDSALRITARPLALQWLQSLLGIGGFIFGLVLIFLAAKAELPKKLYLVLWIAPAIAGVVLGFVLGRRFAAKRPPIVREIPRDRVTAATQDGAACQILVKAGLFNKNAITFLPDDKADGARLVAALKHTA